MKKILGVDPGLAATGIGLVAGDGIKVDSYSFGVIETKKDYSLPVRLDIIYSKLVTLLAAEKPDLIVVEDVFSLQRYPKSGILLGKVTGVVLLAGCRSGVEIREVPVREAKKILSGNGNAKKSQLELSVRNYLGHDQVIKPDHSADALALALIGLFRFDKWCNA